MSTPFVGFVLIENAEAIVGGVVCDGASRNRTMWRLLGVSGDMNSSKNFFEPPADAERKVYMFSDVPHLLKCIGKGRLSQKCLKVNGKEVKRADYVSLFKEDELNLGDLKVCPRITLHHPSKMDKMRVKFATQIFSASMATGLKYYKERGFQSVLNCEAPLSSQ
ncbi:hypothetical protein HPB49_016948 [Dermacentor silvarum]|uniref:Uncharacterized protein n=1 Tax=Dermacentor silvarum TaxID=543639 RepID=A0ACB8C4G6_DERSI|nr:hypothetical protein HPB49_016948 [Dermacentor silvarum]